MTTTATSMGPREGLQTVNKGRRSLAARSSQRPSELYGRGQERTAYRRPFLRWFLLWMVYSSAMTQRAIAARMRVPIMAFLSGRREGTGRVALPPREDYASAFALFFSNLARAASATSSVMI